MLSTTNGIPFAKIFGNKKYKSINIFIEDTDVKDDSCYDDINDDMDPYDIINEDAIEKLLSTKKIKGKEKDLLNKIVKQSVGKEFHIKEGIFQAMPNLRNERDVLYIAGPSGSGKSTYVSQYVRNYCRAFPKNEVYVFSAVDSDTAFEGINKLNRINISEELMDEEIDLGLFSNSCCIFDDIDVVEPKHLKIFIQNLRNKILQIGRHKAISICCTSHLICDYQNTRTLLNESHFITIFPRSGSSYHISRLCKTYLGLNKEQIERLLDLPSRWVTIHQFYPKYVFYDKGCFTL